MLILHFPTAKLQHSNTINQTLELFLERRIAPGRQHTKQKVTEQLLAPGWPCQDSNLDHLYGQTEASTEHKTSYGACPSLSIAVLKHMQPVQF